VDLVTEDADFHPGPGDVGEFHNTGETLIPLGIVILKTNLELNGLAEFPLLISGFLENLLDLDLKTFVVKLGHFSCCCS